ncbi:hypothetical protein HY480_03090 [Candidatus Uhrbacteria bacterium]|nr:hypothetical protein [Candidatus Uhrbacteria bacterium]
MAKQYRLGELKTCAVDVIVQIARNELKIPQQGLLGDRELREAVISHARQRGLLLEGDAEVAAAAEAAPGGEPQDGDGDEAVDPVIVRYTPYDQEFPALVGQTAQYALDQLRTPWSIDPDTRVFLNGDVLEDFSAALEAGDVLEISRKSGSKG